VTGTLIKEADGTMPKKKETVKIASPSTEEWSRNPDYETRRGICDLCGQREELKLSFDRVRFICVNASVCLVRWKKINQRNKEPIN
jgi:hypothetical protein